MRRRFEALDRHWRGVVRATRISNPPLAYFSTSLLLSSPAALLWLWLHAHVHQHHRREDGHHVPLLRGGKQRRRRRFGHRNTATLRSQRTSVPKMPYSCGFSACFSSSGRRASSPLGATCGSWPGKGIAAPLSRVPNLPRTDADPRCLHPHVAVLPSNTHDRASSTRKTLMVVGKASSPVSAAAAKAVRSNSCASSAKPSAVAGQSRGPRSGSKSMAVMASLEASRCRRSLCTRSDCTSAHCAAKEARTEGM